MDSNAHSCLYGTDTNSRGEELELFLINYGLILENIGTKPTFRATRGDEVFETTIDVTITGHMTERIKNWRVLDDYNGSDHRTIRYQLNDVVTRKEKVRQWDGAKWDIFQQETNKCRLYHPVKVNEKKLDKMVECLYKVINIGLDKAAPEKLVKITNKDFYWYTEEHANIKKAVNRLYILSLIHI